jgi:hypothetical protein
LDKILSQWVDVPLSRQARRTGWRAGLVSDTSVAYAWFVALDGKVTVFYF